MRFAHLKTHHRFERMRLRGLSGTRDEFHLAAIVQNLKTMAMRLTPPTAGVRPPPAGSAGRRQNRQTPKAGNSHPDYNDDRTAKNSASTEFFNRIGQKRKSYVPPIGVGLAGQG